MKHKAAIAEKEASVPQLRRIAAELAAEATNYDDLKSKLAQRINASEELTREAIIIVVNDLSRISFINLRSDIASTSATGTPIVRKGERYESSKTQYLNAITTVLGLYDLPLPITRIKLGDATPVDLSDVKDYYLGSAESAKRKGDAYRRLQEKLVRSNKPTVREAFSEDEIRKILGDDVEDDV